MEKGECITSQRRGANTVIICDMIRLQIRLTAVLARLQASPGQKSGKRLLVPGAGIEPQRSFRGSSRAVGRAM